MCVPEGGLARTSKETSAGQAVKGHDLTLSGTALLADTTAPKDRTLVTIGFAGGTRALPVPSGGKRCL